MPVHQVSVVCGFCKLGTVVNDICGPLHKSHLKNGSVCAAHHRCMQYSYFLGQYKFKKFGGFKIDEVLKEMKRAKKLKCVLCKKSKLNGGASAKCGYYYCNRSFHYYCAQTNDKCFVRRICIRRQKSSRPIILYRIFCSKEHEKKCLDRGALFQEAFSGLDSYDDDDDDDISDSSGESENDFELIEDVFKKKKAEKLARMKLPSKQKPVEQPKQLSRAERFKLREKFLQENKTVSNTSNKNVKEESCMGNTRNSNSQNDTTKDENNQSSMNFSNCNDLVKMKCSQRNCQNIHTISKVLNNRILSVVLEKLSDSVFNMNDISVKDKNGYCIQNLVKESGRTNFLKKTKRNDYCKINSQKKSEKSCEKSDCQKQQSVVKISGSCQKLVKEVRKGLFGDPVGALIQICLEKLPLDQCVQGSVNLLDQKTSKLTGQQQSLTDLTSQAAASLNKADSLLSNGYMQVQDQKKQAAQPEVYSEETLIIENELLLPSSEFTGRNTLEYQHQNNSNDSLENGCSDVESLAQTEPTLISLNSTPPEIRVSPDEEEENGPVNLQVETLSVDLTNCTQPSSPHITSSQEQETMVLCICRNKKCDLQSQSRILRICKNRYQASKMNIFFWHDIMPPSFKPEYLPYFFLDIVECLRLKMYEVFFTLLFRFDQKHSEKFQYLIDIEDDSVIKEQEDNIWTTVASYLKKASLDSGKEVGILMSLEEQEVMLLPINEVNDRSCKIRRQLLRLRSKSQVMDTSIQDVTQEAYTLKSWLQVNLQERYQVFYKPDDDVISLSDLETSCTNQLYMYLKQHALNTTTGNAVGYGKLNMLDVSDKMDYVLCIGSVNTDIVNYLNYCEKALLQFITKLEDQCSTIYCILDIGEARGISQAFQILPKNEIWQGQVEVFSAVVPGAKLNFCVILKIVPSQTTCDNGNLSQTEKCKKRLGDVSEVVNAEKRAKF